MICLCCIFFLISCMFFSLWFVLLVFYTFALFAAHTDYLNMSNFPFQQKKNNNNSPGTLNVSITSVQFNLLFSCSRELPNTDTVLTISILIFYFIVCILSIWLEWIALNIYIIFPLYSVLIGLCCKINLERHSLFDRVHVCSIAATKAVMIKKNITNKIACSWYDGRQRNDRIDVMRCKMISTVRVAVGESTTSTLLLRLCIDEFVEFASNVDGIRYRNVGELAPNKSPQSAKRTGHTRNV